MPGRAVSAPPAVPGIVACDMSLTLWLASLGLPSGELPAIRLLPPLRAPVPGTCVGRTTEPAQEPSRCPAISSGGASPHRSRVPGLAVAGGALTMAPAC